MKQIFLVFHVILSVAANGQVIDKTGNTYKTIDVGSQSWTTDYLSNTKYSNGDDLMYCKNEYDWKYAFENKIPAYRFKDYNMSNKGIGAEYNYFAVVDERNLAPEGWRIPSIFDLISLHEQVNENIDDLMLKEKHTDKFPKACYNCKDWTNEYRFNHGGCDICKDRRYHGEEILKTFYTSDKYEFGGNTNDRMWLKTKYINGHTEVNTWGFSRNIGDVITKYNHNTLEYHDKLNLFSSNYKLYRSGVSIKAYEAYKIRCVKGQPETYNLETKINDQTWMGADLDVEAFSNGDAIFHAKTKEDWINAWKNKTPAYCYFENNTNAEKLYNYYAVVDRRGLAPSGWHIASSSDWKELILSYRYPKEQFEKELTFTKKGVVDENFNFSYRPGLGESVNVSKLYGNWWCSDGGLAFKSSSFTCEEYQPNNSYGCGLTVRCVKNTEDYNLEQQANWQKIEDQKKARENKIKLITSGNNNFSKLLSESYDFQITPEFFEATDCEIETNKFSHQSDKKLVTRLCYSCELFKTNILECDEKNYIDSLDRFSVLNNYFIVEEKSRTVKDNWGSRSIPEVTISEPFPAKTEIQDHDIIEINELSNKSIQNSCSELLSNYRLKHAQNDLSVYTSELTDFESQLIGNWYIEPSLAGKESTDQRFYFVSYYFRFDSDRQFVIIKDVDIYVKNSNGWEKKEDKYELTWKGFWKLKEDKSFGFYWHSVNISNANLRGVFGWDGTYKTDQNTIVFYQSLPRYVWDLFALNFSITEIKRNKVLLDWPTSKIEYLKKLK